MRAYVRTSARVGGLEGILPLAGIAFGLVAAVAGRWDLLSDWLVLAYVLVASSVVVASSTSRTSIGSRPRWRPALATSQRMSWERCGVAQDMAVQLRPSGHRDAAYHTASGVTDPHFEGEVTIFANIDDYGPSGAPRSMAEHGESRTPTVRGRATRATPSISLSGPTRAVVVSSW